MKSKLSGPLRFLVYLVVIVVAVGGGLWYCVNVQPTNYGVTVGNIPKVPNKTWKVTPEIMSAVNEGFTVDFQGIETSPPPQGSNWPQFNGANRDNRSSDKGLLDTWPESGPPLLWSAEGLGSGYSSVTVVDGVVYTMGNKSSSEAVMALSAGDGKKLWSVPIGPASSASMGEGPRSTPTYSDGFVYALGAAGELVCVEAQSGKPRWQRNILVDYAGPEITWGICESVLIDGDRLICTPGGPKRPSWRWTRTRERRSGNR